MTKSEAIKMFGGRRQDLADALQVDLSMISKLPDPLSDKYRQRVIGVAVDKGILKLRKNQWIKY